MYAKRGLPPLCGSCTLYVFRPHSTTNRSPELKLDFAVCAAKFKHSEINLKYAERGAYK